MKKPLLTLAVLSTVLNLNPAMAKEISHLSIGQIESSHAIADLDGIFLFEIQDRALRKQIEKDLNHLVSLSKFVESDAKSDNAAELEEAILSLKGKITILEEQRPEIANQVKSKVLAEMLRTGVVVVDQDETSRFNRVQLTLNDSIVAQLESRAEIIGRVAGEGVVCI